MDWLPGVEGEGEVDVDGNCDEGEKKSPCELSELEACPSREVERAGAPGLEEDSKGGRKISPDSPPELALSFAPEDTNKIQVDKAVVNPKKAKILAKMKKRKRKQKKKTNI